MFDGLIKLLFPPKCIFCGTLLQPEEQEVCSDCQQSILLACRAPRQAKGAFYDAAVCALDYEGSVRSALHRFKFSGKQSYAPALARILCFALGENLTQPADCVTYVPTNRRNLHKRGYNHAQLLAQEVAAQLKLPLMHTLRKTRDTQPMFGLKPEQRRANILGAIALDCPAEEVEGKRILLLDDILTTGSTVSECARILKTGGAKAVYVAAVAAAGND